MDKEVAKGSQPVNQGDSCDPDDRLGLSETGRIAFDLRTANIPASMTATAYTNDSFVIEPSRDCPIAGYLIVSPIIPASSLSELRREALDSLGATLAAATRAIEKVIHPERVYCALFAEEKHSVHFHLFPRSRWVLSQYAAAHQVERDVSGPQLFDWARRTFHSPAPANYDELTEAIFRELRPNG